MAVDSSIQAISLLDGHDAGPVSDAGVKTGGN